ncbi:Fe-Mn family superoxide dismutase, partial [Mycobacteroides abscessus]|uniref:Fe-Mn family superoxide dismutase n=1 Tax=Mycobacteroides abscessus TaxID=36809 RepID=UPI001F1C8469
QHAGLGGHHDKSVVGHPHTRRLLQVDMWEHAFYLQYKNVKADYVKAFWNVVNWADVQDRYTAATTKTSGLIFG